MSSKPFPYMALGSISHGTMREEDLIPAFVSALESVRTALLQGEHEDQIQLMYEIDDLSGSWESITKRVNFEEFFNTEESREFMERLENALGQCVPPYCYFGSNEGDGADYGVWPDTWAVEELYTKASMPSYVVERHGGGTYSLFEVNVKELWSTKE